MNNDDDFDDDDFDGDDDFEYEMPATKGQNINWRKIELLKEKMWLKKQLEDF